MLLALFRAGMIPIPKQVQVSPDGSTVWVHVGGSTVGRFSRRFGIDVHATVDDQLSGKPQCLHCTHRPADKTDWDVFCDLMDRHFDVTVDRALLSW